jgi:hypothetical protein
MSVGSLGGILGSAAGAPLSQTSGSEAERTQRDSATQQRQTDTDARAERAAGIGTTEQDQETNERDADGRRMWEAPPEKQATDEEEPAAASPRQSKDATGLSGTHLDLTG